MHSVVNATASRAVRLSDRGVTLLPRIAESSAEHNPVPSVRHMMKKSSGARERGHVDSNTWL